MSEQRYILPLRLNLGNGPTTSLTPDIYGDTPSNYTITDLDGYNEVVDYVEVISEDGTRWKVPHKVNGRSAKHHHHHKANNKHVESVALVKVNDTDYLLVPEYAKDHTPSRVSPRSNVTVSRRSPRSNGNMSPRSNGNMSPRSVTLRNGTVVTTSPRNNVTVSRRSPTRSRTVSTSPRRNNLNNVDTVDIIAFIPEDNIINRGPDNIIRINPNSPVPSLNTFSDLVRDGSVLLTTRNGSLEVKKLDNDVSDNLLGNINNVGNYLAEVINNAGNGLNNLLQPVQQQSEGFLSSLMNTLGLNGNNNS